MHIACVLRGEHEVLNTEHPRVVPSVTAESFILGPLQLHLIFSYFRFFTNLKAAIENLESKTTTKTKQKLTAKKVDNTKISTNGHQKDSGDVTNSADIHQKVFGDVIQSTNSKLTNTCNNDEEVVEDCAFMFEET